MNSAFFHQIESVLHTERLDSYRQDMAGSEKTLARYLLNMALCEALYPTLQFAEIALRNAIHKGLSARYVRSNWYDSSIGLTPWQLNKIQEAKDTLTQKGKLITPGRIVAELTFGFWTGFFNQAHARSGLGHYLAGHVFPHAPRTERSLSKLDSRWQAVRDLRNRVFHHERIIHWQDLDAQHAKIIEVTGWMSPELRQTAAVMDRFATLRAGGLAPWMTIIEQQWPAPTPPPAPASAPVGIDPTALPPGSVNVPTS